MGLKEYYQLQKVKDLYPKTKKIPRVDILKTKKNLRYNLMKKYINQKKLSCPYYIRIKRHIYKKINRRMIKLNKEKK